MTVEAQKVGEIKGIGTVYRVDAPLDEQIRAFQNVGIQFPYLATPEEIAQIRLGGVSGSWSRTSVSPVAIKGGDTILYKNSPWLSSPEMATVAVQAHREGRFPQLPSAFYESVKDKAKKEEGMEPEDRTAIAVSQKGDSKLTSDMPEAKFLLGKLTKQYFGKFALSGQIQFYNLEGDSKNQATVNYLWFGNPQYASNLYCRGRGLGLDYRAFGVLRTGEASAQNTGYSLSQIGKANSEVIPSVLGQAGLSGITENIARKLSKGLIDRLRGK